jgi:hypothetical protein
LKCQPYWRNYHNCRGLVIFTLLVLGFSRVIRFHSERYGYAQYFLSARILFRFALAFKSIPLGFQGIGHIRSFGISWKHLRFGLECHSSSFHFLIVHSLHSYTCCPPPLGPVLLFQYPASVCQDSAPYGCEGPRNSLIAMRMVLIAFAFANLIGCSSCRG